MGTVKRTFANNLLTSGKIDATDGLSGTIPATNLADASITNVTSFPSSLGGAVSSVASDPPSPSEGQIWFNSTSNVLKQYSFAAGTWATGGNMNTARSYLGGAGTQTAGLAMGGYTPALTGATEEYDGNSWTNSNPLNTARSDLAGAGIQTAALAFGGQTPTVTSATEEWAGAGSPETKTITTA